MPKISAALPEHSRALERTTYIFSRSERDNLTSRPFGSAGDALGGGSRLDEVRCRGA